MTPEQHTRRTAITAALAGQPWMSTGELADVLDVRKAQALHTLQRMEREGLVTSTLRHVFTCPFRVWRMT